MIPVDARPKPLAMNPMTLPLCSGNHMTGVVMVTMVTIAREAELSAPYTRARLHTMLSADPDMNSNTKWVNIGASEKPMDANARLGRAPRLGTRTNPPNGTSICQLVTDY